MKIALRSRAGGFTLVEVLVALVIMAIIAGMAWQGVDGIVRARDASQQRLEQTLRLNTVIGQWQQDLASLQDSVIARPVLECTGALVRMTRRAPGGLQVVVWTLRPEAAGSPWLRWASPVATTAGELQDSWIRSQQLMDNDPRQLRTLEGISEWQVYFYQTNAWSNCQSTGNISTGTGSGSTGAPVLPAGVRLVLTFASGSSQSGTLTRDTLIEP